MNSARDSRPPDATTSRAEQVLMVLGSDPVDKLATDGPPLRSEANNVSITGSPLNSIKTQAIHSPPVPCSLDPLPSPASQATGVFPLNSEMSAKIETHKNKITLQTSTDHPSCSLICVCDTPTSPIQTPRTAGWSTHSATLGVVGVITSARGRRPLDANPSKTEQMLMVLGVTQWTKRPPMDPL